MTALDERLIVLLAAATPRPWVGYWNTVWDDPGYIRSESGDHVAYVRQDQRNPDTYEADAKLIVALRNTAPELLAIVDAARGAVEVEEAWLPPTAEPEWGQAFRTLREALRVLDGKESSVHPGNPQ